ncbi:type I restriction-modification system subunit M [Nitrosomonas nitrosa]|uniref:type I restriction-modification system subunit M n=1 Tax=Nitrosomonas nitrosa TaxID=52442 RepID=UPI0023F74A18|nr:type I restriction-modification system subunit M [Nitrosomonas nitrosa]MCO6434807.1 type I restriction-modification system subunit M [Nitrosomonas nitrosa]
MSIDIDKIWTEVSAGKIDSMTVSEYKTYVLAFLFYRYLSEIQEQYLAKNNVLEISCGMTVNQAYAAEATGDDLADYLSDIASSLGYAIAPSDTWETLIAKIEGNAVIPSDYQTLFLNFDRNALLNVAAQKNFQKIFGDVNLSDPRLGSDTNARTHSLNKIVKLVAGFEYGDKAGALFGKLIERFAASAGKTGGQFYTPQSVSQIMAKIVTDDITESDSAFTVYDPTCGSGSTVLALRDEVPGGHRPGAIKYYGQEKELTTYNLARMNLLLNGVSYSNIILNNADTLEIDWPDGQDAKGIDHPRSFDAIVADIQFGKGMSWDNSDSRLKDPRFKDYGRLAPKNTPDYAFILHSLFHLNEGGTMAMVLPHGVLFRGKAEGTIRENLIKHRSGNMIHAVIGLPENIMFSEKGKKSVAVVIVVFKKKRATNDILFIDASNDFLKGKNKNYLTPDHIKKIIDAYHNREDVPKYAHLAALDEIMRNEYNLNIPRYVSTYDEEPPIDLEEVMSSLDAIDAEIAITQANVDASLKALGVKRIVSS